MEKRNDSTGGTPDHSIDQGDAADGRSVVGPKISTTINATQATTNALRENTARENKGISKETSAPGSNEVGDAADGGDKSARQDRVGAMMPVRQVTSADGTREESQPPSDVGSRHRSRGRSARRQRRPFGDMIGVREQRREQLEKMEGDLRQRLDMLECSLPAVMAWNTWKMTQGASACGIRRVLERQFKAASELPLRATPSCHYDCRVREVEAERKLAQRKVEEARALWAEKLRMLEDRTKQLEEARKMQEEQRGAMDRLNKEIERLREAMEQAEEDEESCRHGECGDRRCKRTLLAEVSSVTSIESGDIECLEKLQQLVEEELVMKKDIAELERREDAYMRTLKRAEELWSKVEEDAVSSTSALQEQLDTKTAANQQLADRVCELEDALEKCRARMAACRTELEKYLSIEKLEAAIGRDDDVALVTDKAVAVKVKVTDRPIGRPDDVAMVKDDEVSATVEVADERIMATVEVADEEVSAVTVVTDADAEAIPLVDDKYVSVRPEVADLAVERQVDLVPVGEKESAVQPEDFDHEQQTVEEIREYLNQLASLDELYEDDGEPCPPDFPCNDVVTSPTGMTDEELIAMGMEPAEATEQARRLAASEEKRKREVAKIADKADRGPRVEREAVEKTEERVALDGPIMTPETRRLDAHEDVVIKRDVVLAWIDRVDAIRTEIARYPELRAVKEEADALAKQIRAHVGVKPREVVVDTEVKLEGKIKYVAEAPAKLPKISPVAEARVKPVISPDVMTEAAKVDIERAKKLEDKSVVPKEEVKLESKTPSIPIPEEALAEADLAKDEISAEPSEVVSVETPQITEKAERKEKEEIISERVEKIEVKTEPEITEPSKAVPIRPPEAEMDDEAAMRPAEREEQFIVPKMERREEEETIAEDTARVEIKIKDAMEREPVLRAEITETEEPTDEAAPTVDVKEEPALDEVSPRVDAMLPAVKVFEETETLRRPITKVKEVEKVAPARVVAAAGQMTAIKEETLLLDGEFHVFEAFKVQEEILIVEAKSRSEVTGRSAEDQGRKFEERELLCVTSEAKLRATKPPFTSAADGSVIRRALASPLGEAAQEVEIVARSVQTELVTGEARLPVGRAPSARIISEYLKPAGLEARSVHRPEITGRKMLWRLRDQSTVTTASAGSQTDKASRVSHDRVERERARLATDELLRSIKIAAGRTRGDAEREIRTIHYDARLDDEATATKRAAVCDCCLCGNATSSLLTTEARSRVAQPDARTTTPLMAAFKRALVPLKTDHVIPYDRLCLDCKAKIQGKVMRDKRRIESIVEKVSQDRESYFESLPSSSAGTCCHAVPLKRTVEKRDQCCSVKIPRRKPELAEQKRRCDQPTLAAEVKPLTPSCICFQLEKPIAGPMKKGNCYCAD